MRHRPALGLAARRSVDGRAHHTNDGDHEVQAQSMRIMQLVFDTWRARGGDKTLQLRAAATATAVARPRRRKLVRAGTAGALILWFWLVFNRVSTDGERDGDYCECVPALLHELMF